MGNTLHWPALVTLATLALLFGCAAYVGKCRVRYKVSAPATTGSLASHESSLAGIRAAAPYHQRSRPTTDSASRHTSST